MDFVSVCYSATMRGALNSLLGMMHAQRTTGETDQAGVGVRIAVYPRGGEPEITEVSAANPRSATQKFTRFVSERVREAGGRVPEESIREVVENLIHADYRGVVISVLDGRQRRARLGQGTRGGEQEQGDGVRIQRRDARGAG